MSVTQGLERLSQGFGLPSFNETQNRNEPDSKSDLLNVTLFEGFYVCTAIIFILLYLVFLCCVYCLDMDLTLFTL